VASPTLYVHATLRQAAELDVDTAHAERAVYVVEGSLQCDGRDFEPGTLLVLPTGVDVVVRAIRAARILVIGGAPLDGERHMYWNFVSSSNGRIERSKQDWAEGRFPRVPGDDLDFVPLP
jgi:redox-sensitive bicupin YhaK (pirin superfamily)